MVSFLHKPFIKHLNFTAMKRASISLLSLAALVGAPLTIALVLVQVQFVQAASLIPFPVPFDTLNYDLADNFNPGTGDLFATTTDGGLGNSGAANVEGRTNLYTHKDSFEIPDVGETASVSAYFKFGNGGGSGYIGFVASSSVDREDAESISEPGIFARVQDEFDSISAEGTTQDFSLHPHLTEGEWYKVVFSIVPQGDDLYDAHLQIWNATSTSNETVSLRLWRTVEDIAYPELGDSVEDPGEIHAFFGNSGEFFLVDNFEVRDEALVSPWEEGDGETAETAYEITSCEELQAVGSRAGAIDAFYRLEADVNCAETASWNGGEGFISIGTKWDSFSGEFDGNNKVISNLYINQPNYSKQGLFATFNGMATSLGLENVDITGVWQVGGFAGDMSSNAVVEDSFVTGGSIVGEGDVGGFVGYKDGGVISRSYAEVSVTASSGRVGGFAGRNTDGLIEESYATGDVVGSYEVGGFAGDNSGVIENAYARGTVTASEDVVGGFAGSNYGQIFYAYSTGDVTQTEDEYDWIGGFVGDNGSDTVYSSFSVGEVSAGEGSTEIGGFIGIDYLSHYNSGWWTGAYDVAIGQTWDEGESNWIGPTAEISWNQDSPEDFKDITLGLYTTASSDIDGYDGGEEFSAWDFSEEGIWGINDENPEGNNDGWPFFRWQGLTHSYSSEEEEVTPEPRRSSSRSGSRVVPRQTDSASGSLIVPSAASFTRDLETGSSGTDVRELQKFLNARGFTVAPSGPGSPGNETNLFGALTRQALARFQAAHGIAPATGNFGPLTRAYIANTGAAVPTDTLVSSETVRDLDMGMTGDDVRALQTLLMAQGYSIPAGATGYFATQTRDALSAYQLKNGVTPAQGYFGERTRAQMKAAGLSGLWW